MAKEVKEEKQVVFDEEQQAYINQHYVTKEEFQRLNEQNQKVVRAFNKLLSEYNNLHIKQLLSAEE